jgi:hypothetical protein
MAAQTYFTTLTKRPASKPDYNDLILWLKVKSWPQSIVLYLQNLDK